MPAQDYYDPPQVLNHLHKLVDDHKASLGLRYVAKQDELLLPEYPAALVSMEAPLRREQRATRLFRLVFTVDIWVFHARLSTSKGNRSMEDIQLATNVRKLLHQNYTLPDASTPVGHIVFGYVESESPGLTRLAGGRKTEQVVTTRLVWVGENRVRYEDA